MRKALPQNRACTGENPLANSALPACEYRFLKYIKYPHVLPPCGSKTLPAQLVRQTLGIRPNRWSLRVLRPARRLRRRSELPALAAALAAVFLPFPAPRRPLRAACRRFLPPCSKATFGPGRALPRRRSGLRPPPLRALFRAPFQAPPPPARAGPLGRTARPIPDISPGRTARPFSGAPAYPARRRPPSRLGCLHICRPRSCPHLPAGKPRVPPP
jgi:hypothetical protein